MAPSRIRISKLLGMRGRGEERTEVADPESTSYMDLVVEFCLFDAYPVLLRLEKKTSPVVVDFLGVENLERREEILDI